MRRESKRREDAATSRHLWRLANHVQAGAHIILRGQLRDDVLVGETILDEASGIAAVLAEQAGIDRVLICNSADGTYALKEDEQESVEEFYAEAATAEGSPVASMRHKDPVSVAAIVRTLMRQRSRPVAIVLEDPATMFDGGDEQTRGALTTLMEAMAEAAFSPRNGSAPVRNTVILYGSPDGPAVGAVAAVPGVEEVNAEPPNLDERLVALRELRRRFYRGGNGGKPTEDDLETLARLTDGYSLRAMQQLSRASHAVETPATRPETLYRKSRGRSVETPLGEVGVETVMKRLRAEIRGQDPTLEEVQSRLELGCWRSANRASGAHATRPMATLVLHGPPGVGKTETALILAEALLGSRQALHRIDCSEFHSKHDLARLVGAPPGYVGYREGGGLAEVLGREASVILFDEYDRAEGLAEMMLGILDAGRLTDGRGRTASFENSILLLSTNLGFTENDDSGYALRDHEREVFIEEITKKLKKRIVDGKYGYDGSPALWSRLEGSLVGYDVLRDQALDEITDQSCERLERNLGDEFDIELSLDAAGFRKYVAARVKKKENWDGRSIGPVVAGLIEVPVRNRLVQLDGRGLSSGAKFRFKPDGEGFAVLS